MISKRKVNALIRSLLNWIKRTKRHEEKMHIAALLLSLGILLLEIIFHDSEAKTGAFFHGLEGFKHVFEIVLFLQLVFLFLVKLALKYLDPMRAFWKTLLKQIEEVPDGNLETGAVSGNFTIKVASIKDLSKIVGIADEVWYDGKFNHISRFYNYRVWTSAQKNCISVIKKGDEEIGFIIMLPLRSDHHFNGQRDKGDINLEILAQEPNTASYIYLDSIYVRDEFQKDKELSKMIYREIMNKITTFVNPEKTSIIYTHAHFHALKKFLAAIGFGSRMDKNGNPTGSLQILAIKNFKVRGLKKLGPSNEMLDTFNMDPGKADNFMVALKSVYNKKVVVPADMRLFNGSSISQFFENAARCPEINPNNTFIKLISGKNFKFYTHAIYKTEDRQKGVIKKHFLSVGIIEFQNPKGNIVPVSLNIPSNTNGVMCEYMYEGIMTMHKSREDVMMIFYPKLERRAEGSWKPYRDRSEYVPIILTGRVLRPDNRELIVDNDGESLLSLHMTAYSYHNKNSVSKIGILDLETPKDNKIGLQTLEITADDPLKDIKLYLMRPSKVIIKSPENNIFNNKNHMSEWFNSEFGNSFKEMNENYELFYYRRRDGKKNLMTANVHIMKNGLAILNRKKINSEGKVSDEKYYGEINLRHLDVSSFLYIKFIAIESDIKNGEHRALNQHYKEIFLLLFWNSPKPNSEPLDFTRGIILGDKDVEEWTASSDKCSITASVCVLCNANERWKKSFPENLEADLRLRTIETNFVSKILKGKPIEIKNEELLKHDLHENDMASLFSAVEIEFDEKICRYSKFLDAT